jgi:flagellar biosynthetic protein FlhB
MAEDRTGERTEQATPKRRADARKKGQVPRSRELTTALILLMAGVGLSTAGGWMVDHFSAVAMRNWQFAPRDFKQDLWMLEALRASVGEALWGIAPLMAAIFLAALAGPVALGGWTFSIDAMAFKGERLSPLKGFKRMLGANAAMELAKAIGKFAVVSLVAWWTLSALFPQFLSLGELTVERAMATGLSLVSLAFLGVSASLLLIAAIDVPYQLWSYGKQLKMTRQEIKDEYKETEGRPEVKSKIRQIQREMAQRRMMAEVPQADVVITNPEHYSVALKYEDFGDRAPVVVAKGTDLVALKIREIAAAHDVAIVPAPPLARSLYHTTELGEEIPRGLYLAVAQVLAYVYQLKTYRRAGQAKPRLNDDLPIPDDLRY